MKKKLPINCENCGSPLTIRSFRVLTDTSNPKVYKIRMLKMGICEKCKIAYATPKELRFIQNGLIAWEASLDEILFS